MNIKPVNTAKTFLGVLSFVFVIGVVIGLFGAVRSIAGNNYMENGFGRLVGLGFQRHINTGVLSFGLGLCGLFLVWWLLSKTVPKKKKRVVRADTAAVLVVLGLFATDRLLRVSTPYTLKSAVGRFWARLGETFTGDISAREFLDLLGKHSLAAGICAAGVLLAVFLFWRVGKIDLRSVYYRRRMNPNPVLISAVILAALLIGLNAAMVVDKRLNTPKGPNIIFICIDALRADCLGVYGYHRDTSPFVDRVAREGVVFTDAVSQSSWTKTSVASFLTSDYGVLGTVATRDDKLPLSAVTLAEILQNRRYRTCALVANPWLEEEFGFDQGFDRYDTSAVESQRIGEEAVIACLERLVGRPFFLYLHLMGVHNPYRAPEPYFEMFAETGGAGEYRYLNGIVSDVSKDDVEYTRALYDGEIRFVDEKISRIFDFLAKKGEGDDTIVIIMSDHGDEFLEHGGLGHGTTLYRELLHVPLIFSFPGSVELVNRVVENNVRNIDIVPTLLDVLEIPVPGSVQGKSLLPQISGLEPEPAGDFTLAGVVSVETSERLMCFCEDGYKYIRNYTSNEGELYFPAGDPGDLYNVVDSLPDVAGALSAKLDAYAAALLRYGGRGETAKIDNKTLEKLKSLGYL